ncbi:ABC transporter ATP-binding protein [Xenorhabdus mauleonii]|uniref:ABC transporter ATP-binding protein n=1 Tax=Xenorhabdus mauleonii TaxID=351675 RepID=A0A1I3UBX3_9GAMM|nr:ABC transporter ATP-binding protein [Xenorhabdus mauleonii]PHM45975.1 ABC transporter ATP-binding protein [Xenorhabdus mauleonii]SFJ80119.1 iron complex transport system ATP-binding protein [Xenorhabdus mauleonii]
MNQGLKINQLTAGYPKHPVIENLNIGTLPRGQITVLLGPNGCGKSTLLRSLAGLNKASGELLLDGQDLMQMNFAQRAKNVVYLPQSLPAGVHLHALESVIVAQRASGGVNNRQCEQEVMELLRQLGIEHLALSYLDQLSGGQKQLVGLAQSLIRHPTLLLLDEPLSALDLNYQYHVMDLVARETRRRNIITVVVVHDINIALRHGDHVLMLKNGKLISEGLPEQVITPDSLAQVYGIKGRIERCSQGIPRVLIDGLVTELVS